MNAHPEAPSSHRRLDRAHLLHKSFDRPLAQRIAIHIEKGEAALAHRLVDQACLADCVSPLTGLEDRLALELIDTPLPARLVLLLGEAGIDTIDDLLQRRPEQIASLESVGNSGLDEIYNVLARLGFRRS